MSDTMKKTLSDGGGRIAWKNRLPSHQEQQPKSVNWMTKQLQTLQQSINKVPQGIKKATDIIRERLSQEKKSLGRYLNGLKYKKEKFVHTVETVTKNDLSSLKSSVVSRKQSVVWTPSHYITPQIAERIAWWWSQWVKWRTDAYDTVAGYIDASQSNRLVRYLSS